LAARDAIDGAEVSLADLPPTAMQGRLAIGIAAFLVAGFAAAVWLADTPLAETNAFIPIIEATIIITDLTTSVLLFAQFSASRSRALLVLASGYLFTAVIVIPHLLTFPGVFSPTGLLGAGLQTTVWLYIFWHLGFPIAVCGYIWLRNKDRKIGAVQGAAQPAVAWSVAIVLGLAGGLAFAATAGHDFLPRIFLDQARFSPLSDYFAALMLSVGALALVLLWICRRSVLDLWLMIVLLAWIAELVSSALLSSARFEFGWYAGRLYSLVTATVVLAALLAEITKLYTKLARSNVLLQQERNSTLMNLEAMAASIAHEVRQPLTSISISGQAALRFLSREPLDQDEVRSALKRVIDDSHRASQIFDSIRALFKSTDLEAHAVDINEIALDVLRILQRELNEHRIITRTDLRAGLPPILGHKGQLQEVVLNLAHNAIDAMHHVPVGNRILRLTTDHHNHGGITFALQDTGPGIDPDRLSGIFDAFVTTKSHGMGLGLALCRLIIDRHGGKLSASSAKGKGARFEFTLPARSTMPAAAPPS
jgi:signal transduction histidine kinase